jgi:anti-sigma factor ChrR (cupin superfamily)
MSNVTVSVDRDLILRARAKAVGEGRSLSAVVGELLEAYVGSEDQSAALEEMFELADSLDIALPDAGITWTREDLHDRAGLR